MKVVVLGGGAAGFFGAITCAQNSSNSEVLLLEKTQMLLAKLRISGGGRCNVTHACFDPKELVKNYPRGHKALLGPFYTFQPRDTVNWFEKQGVQLKTEEDGRMFPITDSSQTIIDCLLQAASQAGVEIRLQQKVNAIHKIDSDFEIELTSGETLKAQKVLLATGSNPLGLALAQNLGHTIVPQVPSLFTFNIPQFELQDLAGIAVESAQIKLDNTSWNQTGPLLITHWGFSGPCALKLSAWGARYLHEKDYQVDLQINWFPNLTREALVNNFLAFKKENQIIRTQTCGLPRNLWIRLLERSAVDSQKRWSEISHKEIYKLAEKLQGDRFSVRGKTTYKQEFVTCGGIDLDEVNFKTLESRKCPGLFFAGEILDIDGVTGGFNFQNAWTTAWIAGHAMGKN